MRFAALTLFLALGCVSAPAASDKPESDLVVASGTTGRLASSDAPARRRAPWIELATDRETFEQLWNQYVPGEPSESPSETAFESAQVVFLLLGPQQTGGYAIEPLDVTAKGGILRVRARLIQPMSPDDFTTEAVTAPYAVITAPGGTWERIDWIDSDGRLLATRIPE